MTDGAIGRIRDKRDELLRLVARAGAATLSPSFDHGWEGHRFRFRPPLPEGDVAAFERAVGVELPAEYRRFVTEVADGIAGPGYGLFQLGRVGEVTSPKDSHRLAPNTALDVPLRPPSRLAAPFVGTLDAGVLLLAHHGCAGFDGIVLDGPTRGHIWTFWEEHSEPLGGTHGEQGFFAWFESWLDGALREGHRLVALIEETAADRPRSRRLRTPISRRVEHPEWRGDAGAYWQQLARQGDVPLDLFDGDARAIGVVCPLRRDRPHRWASPVDRAESCPECGRDGWVRGTTPCTVRDAWLVAGCLPSLMEADRLARELMERLHPWGYMGRCVTWLSGRHARERRVPAIPSAFREALSFGLEAGRAALFRVDGEWLTGGYSRALATGMDVALALRAMWRYRVSRGDRVEPRGGVSLPADGCRYADLPDPTDTLCAVLRTGNPMPNMRDDGVALRMRWR